MTHIIFIDQMSEDLETTMRKDLNAYDRHHGIDVNYKRFSLVLRNDLEESIGVLNAFTVFSEIYIDDLWVDGHHQRKGYGKKLLKTLENRFKGQGFNNINLVTSQFQSPEFYKKCGFKLELVRENIKNPQLTKFFFVKYFDDEIQTQGILK